MYSSYNNEASYADYDEAHKTPEHLKNNLKDKFSLAAIISGTNDTNGYFKQDIILALEHFLRNSTQVERITDQSDPLQYGTSNNYVFKHHDKYGCIGYIYIMNDPIYEEMTQKIEGMFSQLRQGMNGDYCEIYYAGHGREDDGAWVFQNQNGGKEYLEKSFFKKYFEEKLSPFLITSVSCHSHEMNDLNQLYFKNNGQFQYLSTPLDGQQKIPAELKKMADWRQLYPQYAGKSEKELIQKLESGEEIPAELTERLEKIKAKRPSRWLFPSFIDIDLLKKMETALHLIKDGCEVSKSFTGEASTKWEKFLEKHASLQVLVKEIANSQGLRHNNEVFQQNPPQQVGDDFFDVFDIDV